VNTFERLSEAYEQALQIPFNDEDRFVIMGDAHRGDSSLSDDFSKNQSIYLHALNYYYDRGFTLIENGDGDELWEHRHFSFIYYAHQDIFEMMRKFYLDQRFFMIYGNHNMYMRDPKYVEDHYWKVHDLAAEKRVDLFPGMHAYEAIRLHYNDTGKDIFIAHGHQGDYLNDQFGTFASFLMRYIWRWFHLVGFQNPSSPARSRAKRRKIEKKYLKFVEHTGQFTIMGHTHRHVFSYPQVDLPYFNSGTAVRPSMITAIEIMGGTISMVEWRIFPNIKGILQVKRRVLDGPVSLSKYMG
jgi:UDP-2,3-diacylglucosamine pyrophosphatase LpxH